VGEQENLAVARKFTDALDAGDIQALDALTVDDIVWHEIGRPEPVRGKAALRARMPGPGGVDYTITGKLHDLLASDGHAVALVDATATRGGKTLNYRTVEIYHIRDGKIAERWAFSDDTAAITKFFG
jgi:ketosteroid isomerase-like protein